MLLAGAGLMLFAGILFALTRNYVFLLVAATIGVISPSGNEVGPFLSIEQASLSQIVADQRRTQVLPGTTWSARSPRRPGALVGGGWPRCCRLRGGAAEQLPRHGDRLRRRWGSAGRTVQPADAGHRSAGQAEHATRTEPPRPAPLAQRRLQAVGIVRAGCLRRRICGPEHRGLLVSHPLRRPAGHAGRDFLRRQRAGRHLGAARQRASRPGSG